MRTNVVYCGDCIQGLKKLPNNIINLIIADMPYFEVNEAEWDNSWSSESEFLQWITDIMLECKRVLKENGSLYLFCGISLYPKLRNIFDKLLKYQDTITWKQQRNYGKKGWLFLREEILFYTKSNDFIFYKTYTNIKKQTKGYNSKVYNYKQSLEIRSKNYVAGNVWIDIPELFPRDKEKVKHPAQKPLAIMDRIILASSNKGDLILDPFTGSGSSFISALKNSRKFIGFEISPEYCKIIERRLSQKVMTGFFDTQAPQNAESLNSDLTGLSADKPQILPLAELR